MKVGIMKIGKNAKRNRKTPRSDPRITRAAGAAVIALGTMASGLFTLPSAYAEPTIFTNGTDAAGQDSFDTGLHWTGGLAPVAGNDYVVDDNDQIRTIANGGSQTFAGDALTLGDSTGSGALTFKGNAPATITIANLTLNSGVIQSGGDSGGTPEAWTLTGTSVNGNDITILNTGGPSGIGGFDVDNGATAGRTVTIAANLVGPGSLQGIAFGSNTTPNSINGGTCYLTGTNTGWAGTETITGGSLLVGVGGTAGTLGTGAITDDALLAFDLTNSSSYTQNIGVDTGLASTVQLENISSGTVSFSGSLTLGSATAITNSTGAFSFTGGVAANIPTLTVNNGGGTVAMTSVTGTAGLVVTGTGTTTLSGANNYTGNTTVNGGTLAVVGGTVGVSPLNSPTYTINGTLDVSGAAGTLTTTAAQTITGIGTIVGSLANHGIASGGTIAPGNGATIGTLNFNNGLSLTNGGTLALTLDGASVAPANNDLINVTGPLTLSGVTDLNLTFTGGTPTVGSQYEIITYNGGLTGGTGNFKSLNRTIQVNTATNDVIYAVVTAGGAANLTWNSTSSQNWDIDTTSNWLNPALNNGAGGTDFFFQQDNVTFSDTVPSVQQTVNVTTQLSPGSLTINTTSPSTNFTYIGSGSITTGGAVAFNGPGTATFTNTNNMSGTVTIGSSANSGGTLALGNGGAAGTIGTAAIVNNGTIVFNLNSPNTISNVITGTGNGLIVNGTGNLTLSGANTFAGATTINNGSVFPASATAFGSAANTVTVNSGARLYPVNGLTYAAQTIVLNGAGSTTPALEGGGASISTFTGPVSIESTSIISVDAGATLQLTDAANALSINGNTLYAEGAGVLALGGNTFPGTLNPPVGEGIIASNIAIGLVPAANTTIDINTPISDYTANASLSQTGLGTTQLEVDNYYSGVTTITNGMLEPMTANAIPFTTAGELVGNSNPSNTIAIGGSNSATGTANGALGLTGSITINNVITLGGRQGTFVTSSEIENVAGDNTVASNMTGIPGGNNYTLQSDAGLLTVSGNFTIGGGATGARILNLQGAGNANWTGTIDDGAGIINVVKNGAGAWTLSNTNDFSGGTTIDQGTLTVATPLAMGASATTGTNTGAPGSTTVNATGLLDLDGLNLVEPVILNGGTLTNSAAGTASIVAGVKGVGYSTTTAGVGAASTITFASGAASATPLLGISAASFTLNGGSGYAAAPNVTITPSDGHGSGATATATITAGAVSAITITNAGTGYDAAPDITFSAGNASGTGNATNFALVGVQMNTAGSGYAAAPAATFNNGSGATGAIALTPVIGSVSLAATSDIGGSNGNISLGIPVSGVGGLVKIGADTLTLSAANSYSGGTTVNSGLLEIERTGPTTSALPSGAVAITGGTLQLASNVTQGSGLGLGSSNVNMTSLSVSGSGTLDITNNHIIVDYSSLATDPISSIVGWIKSGYDGGTWVGDGITSSTAAANASSYGIGYADANDPGNPADLPSGQIEVMYTLLGDANLDGKVNGADFTILAANFNQSGKSWDQGDFNYDGDVNGGDFTLLAKNFNQTAIQSAIGASDLTALNDFTAANGISLTSVPEPASVGLLTLTTMGLLARRRRHTN